MEKEPGAPGEGRVGLGWASILAPLALGFAFSLMLAYQAFDAGRQHRATARAAARDHAQFAAYLIASAVDRGMREALLYGFYPIDLALGREGQPLPPPGALRVEPEASRCEPELAGQERRFFQYDPHADEVFVDGPDPDAFESWIRSAIDVSAPVSYETRGVRHAVAELEGRRTLVVYRRWETDQGEVIYGFESCWRTAGGNVFENAVSRTQAFSPTLVGDTPNDSLFRLTARNGDGTLAYGDAWTGPETRARALGYFYGTVDLEPAAAYGGLELRVTLLPEVVERLVEGGLPRSRLPLALGLLSLTGVLMSIAVRQLRRGHELVSLRGRFVRNVSHELRTPLQQILLFTELLRSGRLEDEAKRTQAFDIMHTETRRLIELVHNLLRFSDGRDSQLRPAEIDLATVVRDTVEAFRPLAASRAAEIQIEETRRPRVFADEAAVKRVLINLLDNAVKYGPEGQRIRVRVDAEGPWGEVSISDDGPGIPPEDRERIWQPFRRLEREDAGATAGSGIGLSIVRRLMAAMNGRASLHEDATHGTCFVVQLPIRGAAS